MDTRVPASTTTALPGRRRSSRRTAGQFAERDLRGIYVEENPDACRKLRAVLERTGTSPEVRCGPIEDHLPDILAGATRAPLLAFFDPFGLGIPFDSLTRDVLGRAGSPQFATTEVLLNLSVPGIHRNAGHLTSTSTNETYLRARATILGRLDASLGADWWRPIWESGSEDRTEQIVRGYWERLTAAAGGWGSWLVPVADRWGGPPSTPAWYPHAATGTPRVRSVGEPRFCAASRDMSGGEPPTRSDSDDAMVRSEAQFCDDAVK